MNKKNNITIYTILQVLWYTSVFLLAKIVTYILFGSCSLIQQSDSFLLEKSNYEGKDKTATSGRAKQRAVHSPWYISLILRFT